MDKKIKKNLFIALPLPDQIKSDLLKFNRAFPSRRFSPNLHLTLFFIGSLCLGNYENALKDIIAHSFSLHLNRLGSFSNKILWAGVENSASLLNLQKKISDCMAQLGHNSANRPYSPHITLCRLKSPLSITEKEAFKSITPKGQWLVESFCLYESTLYPEGAIYSCLQSFTLNKP